MGRPDSNNRAFNPGYWYEDLLPAKAGNVAVANNVAAPGLRVPKDCTIRNIYARVGTAPATTAILIDVKDGATTVGTITIAAAATTGTLSPSYSVAEGAILTFNVTQIGTVTTGADLAIAIEAF